MAVRLVADIQNRLFWCARTGRGSECCIPYGMEPGIPRWVAIVLVQAELTVLQTLSIKAVTSANATGAPGLRMYLAHDESRYHRVSGPTAPAEPYVAGL